MEQMELYVEGGSIEVRVGILLLCGWSVTASAASVGEAKEMVERGVVRVELR